MRRILLLIVVIALVVFVVSRCSGGGARRDVEVVIPSGSSLKAAATVLETAGAIDSTNAFLTNAKLFGAKDPIKPGEYRIKRGMDAAAILALLQSGKVIQRFVTVYEGMPSILVYERLYATALLTGEIPVPREGSVLPDSYAYSRGETRKSVLARMQKAMQTEIANAWPKRKPTTAVNTPEAAITLASIIEKETARAQERRLVAAVYSNRLKRGMPLQADPTTIYPITKGKPLGRRICGPNSKATIRIIRTAVTACRRDLLPIQARRRSGRLSTLHLPPRFISSRRPMAAVHFQTRSNSKMPTSRNGMPIAEARVRCSFPDR